MNKTLLAIALTASMGLVGCANNSAEIASVRAIAEKAQSDASRAQQTANAAKASADQANVKADQANAKADSAVNTANEVNEKVDRMFKKTMMK